MKILKRIIIIIPILIIGIYFIGATLTHFLIIKPQYNTATIEPSFDAKIPPGKEFTLKVCAYAPTFAITRARISLPENAVMIGELSKESSFYPLRSKHLFSARIVFLDQEKPSKGDFSIDVSGFCPPLFLKNQKFDIAWPELISPEQQENQQLEIVDHIDIPEEQDLTIFIFLAIFIIFLLVLYKKIRHHIVKKRAQQNLPWVVANKKLVALQENMPNISSDNFFSKLIDILKNYIATIYLLPVDRSTTEEFFEIVKSNQLLQNDRAKQIAQIFSLGDLIKFAKQNCQTSNKQNLIDLAKDFVNTTSNEIKQQEQNKNA